MAKQYGKTWWGQQWLKALTNIDYENRIPRGATYARKGMVRNMHVSGNTISAQVDGSRKRPYDVDIRIPKFTNKEVSTLMDEIENHPAIISRLLNRDLDPAIFRLASDLNIKLFPKRWNDLEMSCSCPDWAVPCKHLAAVVFLIGREIDNNPFLIFSLHGVDLVKELKDRGISIENQINKGAVPYEELLIRLKEKDLPEYNDEAAYIKPDLTAIPSLVGVLTKLLPEETTFDEHGGFHSKYDAQLKKISRAINNMLAGKYDASSIFGLSSSVQFRPNYRYSYEIKEDMTLSCQQVLFSDQKPLFEYFTDNTYFRSLYEIESSELEFLHPSVVASHNALVFALHLLSRGAVIPQITKFQNHDYAIRWMPAIMDPGVSHLMQQLEVSFPPGLLKAKLTGKTLSIMLKNQAEWLVSLFISHIIKRLSKEISSDSLLSFFFIQKPSKFQNIGDASVGAAINIWLDRFYMSQGDYTIVLKIDEAKNSTFHLSVSIAFHLQPESIPVSLNELMSEKMYHTDRYSILRKISLLEGFIPGLGHYINIEGRQPIIFNSVQFAPFLMDIIPAIRLLNIRILMPQSLQQLLKPKPSLRVSKKSSPGQSFLKLQDLLNYDWQVALGNQLVDLDTYMELMGNAGGLIKYKEKYFYVDEADTQRIIKVLSQGKRLNGVMLLQAAFAEEYLGAPVELTDEVRSLINGVNSQSEVALPIGLMAQLRPYQHRGYSWLYRNAQIGFGSVLADDMGLGKTIQVLAYLMKMKEENLLTSKKCGLVVVPSSLLLNWQMEINKFVPQLSAFLYHGSTRKPEDFNHDLMITSYGVLRADLEKLKKMKWLVVVIDEAQNIKNVDTARTKAIKSIKADVKIAMSGTPVENRLSEFWSIMDYTNKGYLGTIASFRENFAKPIQNQHDKSKVALFRKVTEPFMMRRLKTDKRIISDLPDKIEQNEYARLTASQSALYEKTLEAAMNEIEGIEDTDSQSLFQRQGLVLQMILALKQICNHPNNFLKNGEVNPELSGKALLFMDLIRNIYQRNEKVLVFTQFREMGEMLVKMVEAELEVQPMFFHGGNSLKQRNEMVQRFQKNRNDRIFILSLKAAGTGLNLTAASHVIHYDLWWNPAVEAQATDRAYRIGQTNNVFVHRLITKDTFEERIDAMIQQKKELADLTVSTGEHWIGKLSNTELRALFTPR